MFASRQAASGRCSLLPARPACIFGSKYADTTQPRPAKNFHPVLASHSLMNLGELQAEINHLLFLYFTSVGSIQRDASNADIGNSLNELTGEIERCKARINRLLSEEPATRTLPDDFYGIIEEGKAFVDDGLYFINRIVDM